MPSRHLATTTGAKAVQCQHMTATAPTQKSPPSLVSPSLEKGATPEAAVSKALWLGDLGLLRTCTKEGIVWTVWVGVGGTSSPNTVVAVPPKERVGTSGPPPREEGSFWVSLRLCNGHPNPRRTNLSALVTAGPASEDGHTLQCANISLPDHALVLRGLHTGIPQAAEALCNELQLGIQICLAAGILAGQLHLLGGLH